MMTPRFEDLFLESKQKKGNELTRLINVKFPTNRSKKWQLLRSRNMQVAVALNTFPGERRAQWSLSKITVNFRRVAYTLVTI